MFRSLQGLANDLEGKFYLRFIETKGKLDLARQVIRLDKRYGAKHKISFCIIAAHSSGSHINLGYNDIKSLLWLDDLNGPGAQRSSKIFVPSPTIIFGSCFVGTEWSFAQKLARIMKARVVGPVGDSALPTVRAKIIGEEITLQIDYNTEKPVRTFDGTNPKQWLNFMKLFQEDNQGKILNESKKV